MTTLLIIEKNPTHMHFISSLAKKTDPTLTILGVETGKDAIEYLALTFIDIIFVSVELADITAFELIKFVRQKKFHHFTPVVFLANDKRYEEKAYKEHRAYDYLIKPFSTQQLKALMIKLIYHSHKHPQLEQPLILTYKGSTHTLPFETIIFIEYCDRKIKLSTLTHQVHYKHMTLSSFQMLLPDNFIRIHQSFIINSNYIKHVNHKASEISCYFLDKQIPIGKNFKQILKALLTDYAP